MALRPQHTDSIIFGGIPSGTRSVSTLTPAQLARKRANDREAQRAIRARTKEHIDRLERENEELKKAQNADTRVQHFLRKIEMLESENKNLRTQAAQHGLPVPSSDPYSSGKEKNSNVQNENRLCHVVLGRATKADQ